MLKLLDFFFIGFHTVLILFNLTGWTFRRTRKANLIVLLITGGSWFILGIFYGIGYCPLTDWHFDILRKMGVVNLPDSYISYLLHRLTGISFNGRMIDILTMTGYLTALIISVYTNFSKRKLKQND